MRWFKPFTCRSTAWFSLGLLGLWLFALGLRFWGLGRFNSLVFDEIYYVKFAHNYLSQTPFFDGHPPLSKYLIAIGMWLGNQFPIGHDTANTAAGALYTTWSYRWLNAFTGSLIPLVVAGIAYEISQRRSYSLVAGLFVALDGLFLVESRYALNNVYLVIFGLLGWWSLLRAIAADRSQSRTLWLLLAGISFGASASVKWNGLWFLLGAYSMWAIAWNIHWLRSWQPSTADLDEDERLPANPEPPSLLERLTRLSWWQFGLSLGIVPVVFYFLEWIPHLQLNAKAGLWQDFWELQWQILTYHERVGDGPKIHPYCSRWFTWIMMLRPVAYFYQVTGRHDPLPTGKTPPTTSPDKVIYDVHAIGNPILWWLASAAIVLLLWALAQYLDRWLATRHSPPAELAFGDRWVQLSSSEMWLGLFLVVNYAANLVPWMPVTRCTFLYHYMGASVFSTMSIAWFVDRWLCRSDSQQRVIGIATILIILAGFIFWLPLYLGLPLSPAEFNYRLWFRTWV